MFLYCIKENTTMEGEVLAMNKKYQVFVSSPQKGLENERLKVMSALLESKCIPSGMELFPSSNRESWAVIEQEIRESDFFILILAGKAGSYSTDSNGGKILYTEKEYDFAVSIGKPIAAFIHGDIDSLPAKKVDLDGKKRKLLEEFKNKVKGRTNIAFWKDTGTLISEIKSSIQELINNNPSAGWVKGTELNSEGIDNSFLEKLSNLNYWNLEKIFKTRAEKNAESDPRLEQHNTKLLDGIAFGLTSFRSNRQNDVLQCLQNGMNMRLLTMDPASEFVKQRAREEKVLENSISDSINKLVEWVNDLNKESANGKILIKYYNTMTLDFYWRMDDVVYVGPYLYDIVSQQTLTYKYLSGGKGFELYTNYFEKLWNDSNLCYYPANFTLP